MPTDAKPPTTRVRRTQGERVAESSKRLLLAAAELTAEQGFDRTTAGEIGQRAGYSRAMVRDRYGSKEGLVEALFRTELGPRLLGTPREGLTGRERLLDQIDNVEQLVSEDATMARAFFVLTFEAAGPIQVLRPWYKDWFARYEAQMKESLDVGVRDGTIRAGLDADAEAALFVSHALGLAFRWVIDWDDFDFVAELNRWRRWIEQRYTP